MSYRSASARALAFDDALREAMSASVPDAIQPEGAPASDPAAGTPRPEGVAVERVSPGPRLEMFARRNRLGWDTWGDEALEHISVAARLDGSSE